MSKQLHHTGRDDTVPHLKYKTSVHFNWYLTFQSVLWAEVEAEIAAAAI